jgi:hypothetical protein
MKVDHLRMVFGWTCAVITIQRSVECLERLLVCRWRRTNDHLSTRNSIATTWMGAQRFSNYDTHELRGAQLARTQSPYLVKLVYTVSAHNAQSWTVVNFGRRGLVAITT